MNTSSPTRIDSLTALRFFAALLVVFFHHGQAAFADAPAWIQQVIKGGYVGVPFFFILSGFILAYNYLPAATAGTLNSRRFWTARFARIYPVYAVALLIALPFAVAKGWTSGTPGESIGLLSAQAIACFGLVQSWIPPWSFAWNGPAWSLSVEAFFYLSFPFLVCQLDQRKRWWFLALLGIAAASLVGAGRFLGWNAIAAAQQLLGWTNPVLWIALFVLGICVGHLHLSRPSIATSARSSLKLTVLTATLVALVVTLISSRLQNRSQLLLCYAVALPCALLIYLLANPQNRIGRWLHQPVLILLGEASYSLYILHRPIHDWFAWLTGRGVMPSTDGVPGFSLYLATSLALSVAALKWVEYPCREWIKERLSGSNSPRRVATPTISALSEADATR